MALPPYVIVHGVNKTSKAAPIYLGVTGWIALRAQALSFPSEVEAAAWLESAHHDTPLLLRDAKAKVTRAPDKSEEEGDTAPRVPLFMQRSDVMHAVLHQDMDARAAERAGHVVGEYDPHADE